MRTLLAAALTTAALLGVAPQQAEAQPFFPPWMRPRIVVGPPRIVVAPPVFVPPQIYVQPYQQTYAYPPPPVYVQPAPPPPVYVQPAPPPVYVQPAPPPPVYVQPAPPAEPPELPPPPVYQAPMPTPAPVYVQPAPPVAMNAPAPTIQVAKPVPPIPQWRSRFGLGARFVAGISTEKHPMALEDRFTKLGFGGELLYRASRRVVLELSGEYQKRLDAGLERYDVPVLFGTRLHIGAPDWLFSPYFVGAIGGSYSRLDYLRSQDTAWFLEGQLGGGVELRLGQRFVISADVRGDGRYRLTEPDELTRSTQCVNGSPLLPMGNQYGLQGRLGAALFF